MSDSLLSSSFQEKYRQRLEDELSRADELIEDPSWQFVKDKQGASLFQRETTDPITSEPTSFLMFKVHCHIDSNCEEFFETYYGPTRRGDLAEIQAANAATKSAEILAVYEPDEFLSMKISFFGRGLYKGREFFLVRMIEKSPDRIVFVTMSVEDEDEEAFSGHFSRRDVRGRMFMILRIEAAADSAGIDVVNLAWTDPAGRLPKRLFNLFSQGKLFNVLYYKEQLERSH